MQSKLGAYVREPQVTVILTELRSHEYLSRVRVTGAVRTPVSIPYRQGMTVLDAVLAAGGVTEFAAPGRSGLYRRNGQETQSYAVKLDRILDSGDLATNYPVAPGDVITVPERAPMNTALVEWVAPESRLPTTATLLPVVFEETRRRPVFLAAIFATIALGALFFGLTLSKNYTSSTTIMVDENTWATGKSPANVEVVDRSAIAREVAFSRKVMREVLKVGGWMDSHPSALEQEQLIKQIANRTDISSSKQMPNLVRVSYSDSSPLRAYRVAGKLGEMIIQESLAARAAQARSAYEFTSGQVARYHTRLRDAEAKLAAFRKANPDARAGSDEDVVRRIAELRRAVDDARLDLADAQAAQGALRSQLSRQSPLGVMQSRGSSAGQMAELQAERAKLLMSYTDQHPDVVRINSQIRDLQSGARGGAAAEPTLVVPRAASRRPHR